MTIGSYLCNRMGSPYISAVMEHNSIVAYGSKKYQSIKMLHLVQAMLSINVAVLIYKLQVWMQKIVVRHVALLLKIKVLQKIMQYVMMYQIMHCR